MEEGGGRPVFLPHKYQYCVYRQGQRSKYRRYGRTIPLFTLYSNINFPCYRSCMHARCELVNLCSLWLSLQYMYLSSLTSRKLHAFPTCSFSRADHEKQCERFPMAVPLQIYFLQAWQKGKVGGGGEGQFSYLISTSIVCINGRDQGITQCDMLFSHILSSETDHVTFRFILGRGY